MKKILLASTALMMTAGFAAAGDNIKLSGSAEMGVFGVSSDFDGGDSKTQFHTDIDVTFKMSGSTEGGIEFGANIDLDEVDDDEGNDGPDFEEAAQQGGEVIFVKVGNAKLSMGDVNGALDGYFKEYIGVHGGSIADNEETGAFDSQLGGVELLDDGLDGTYGGQIAALDVTLDAVSFGVSVEMDDTEGDAAGEPVYGIGAKFSPELNGMDLTIGGGYQTVEDAAGNTDSVFGLSAEVGLEGGIDIILAYGFVDSETADDTASAFGIGVGYSVKEISLGVSYGTAKAEDADDGLMGYAITAGYDLGGGLELQAGYGFTDNDNTDVEISTYSLGLSMGF